MSRRLWIGSFITLGFLVLLARQVDAGHTLQTLLTADLRFLLAAVPFYFAGVWLRAVRWRFLLRPLRPLPVTALFPHVVMGYAANDLLPARAGELVRAYLVGSRYNLPRAAIIGTVALERIIDGLVLLALSAVIALFIPLEDQVAWSLRATAVLFIGGIAGLWGVIMLGDRAAPVGAWLLRFVPGRLHAPVAGMTRGFLQGSSVLRRPGLVTAGVAAGAAGWLLEAGVFALVGMALGLGVPPWAYLLAMALANLATALPSSQAGIGPFEYFTAQTLVLWGTDLSVGVAYAVLVHVVLIVPVTVLGLFYLWEEGLTLRSAAGGWREAAPAAGRAVAVDGE